MLALVDSGSYYVAGYFEETKLPRIHIGDRASVRLLGYSLTAKSIRNANG